MCVVWNVGRLVLAVAVVEAGRAEHYERVLAAGMICDLWDPVLSVVVRLPLELQRPRSLLPQAPACPSNTYICIC